MTEISRRLLLSGAVGFALATRPAHADLTALEQAAVKEGALTWYIANSTRRRPSRWGGRLPSAIPASASR